MGSLPATHPIIGTNQDDTITGTIHSDVMSGRLGDDVMSGQNGNDEVWGGRGGDTLYGNNGNDVLYGSGGPNVVQVQSITVTDEYPVSVVFEGETAGYRNSFGYYKVDTETGEIKDVSIIWPNASLQGSGGNLVGGETREYLDVSAGDQLGFFIVSNGYSYNNFASFNDGSFAFVDANGDTATLASTNPQLVFQGNDGTTTPVRYHAYHTAAHGDTVGLNPDGILHTTGILKTQKGTITLGFEDLYNGGDRDFDDSVFTVDIGAQNATLLNAHYRTSLGLDNGSNQEGDGPPIVIDYEDDDILYGGTGSDELYGHRGNDALYGENGHDELFGGLGNDVLDGGRGDDELFGNSGDDQLFGGNGHDLLEGSSGDDTIEGGHGNDVLKGGSNDDIVRGGQGNDSLEGNSGNDILEGESGHDTLSGGSGDDVLKGGSGNDQIDGNSGDDLIDGGSGNDVINGGSGIDTVDYSSWTKKISANLLTGVVRGDGTDELISIENMIGTGYDDKIIGSRLANEIDGGAGDDTLIGYTGDDLLNGEIGDDYLNGGSGADTLSGGEGVDMLRGGKGSDLIDGGEGDDVLYGAELGRNDGVEDTFFFELGDGDDVIIDFEVGTDFVSLSDNYSVGDYEAVLSDTQDGALLDFASLDPMHDDSVLLQGVSVADLTSADWLLFA
ncbi:MAG: calcium-binding protein [Pseudomonadota bacterium]